MMKTVSSRLYTHTFMTSETISYSYKDCNKLTRTLSNVNADYTYAYSYDPIGNRVAASEAGVPWTNTTNNLNPCTAATD